MKRLAVLCLLLGVTACGYHPAGQGGSLPGGVKSIYIPLFANQTTEPLLENHLTSVVSEVFARNGQISQVESQPEGKAVLEGAITTYRTRALSYDKNDNIREYRSTMLIAVKLRQVSDGRLLWQGNLDWHADYLAADDKAVQEDLEQAAIAEITRRLAEELYSRLLENF